MRFWNICWSLVLAIAFGATGGSDWNPVVTAAESPVRSLWEIGMADDSTAEFALAPSSYAQMRSPSCFIVGKSNPGRDWSYVLPGPSDSWAAPECRTATILFALRKVPTNGQYDLVFDFADRHATAPPQVNVIVNGHPTTLNLPAGHGDATIMGNPTAGTEFVGVVHIAPEWLVSGVNRVELVNERGSWTLFDQVRLTGNGDAALTAVPHTVITHLTADKGLNKRAGQFTQRIRLAISHDGEERDAAVRADGTVEERTRLRPGMNEVVLELPAVSETTRTVTTRVELFLLPSNHANLTSQSDRKTNLNARILADSASVERTFVRPMTVYILPHSHVDIGYTERQTVVEKKQIQNILTALDLIDKTKDYPEGSRFRWNSEVLWAVDSFLKTASPADVTRFENAVRSGAISIDALYGNELTGCCRPEELVHLVKFSQTLSTRLGVSVDSAMISDVPGYTWGLVPIFAQAGVRYFSFSPNASSRIGSLNANHTDKPFYWLAPDGNHKILSWMNHQGYAVGFIYGEDLLRYIPQALAELEERGFPYDITYIRWAVGGDNGHPDATLSDVVRDWNAGHASPRLVIATTSEAFSAFEAKYADQIPVVRGDLTGYWEDGVGSSAAETAAVRDSAEKLAQLEAILAIRGNAQIDQNSAQNPAVAQISNVSSFTGIWRDILLYNEHTWGAHNSVSQPDEPFVRDQWAYKKAFADQAAANTDRWISCLIHGKPISMEQEKVNEGEAESESEAKWPDSNRPPALTIYNTASWERGDWLTFTDGIPRQLFEKYTLVDGSNRKILSQEFAEHQCAIYLKSVPALGSTRLRWVPKAEAESLPDAVPLDTLPKVTVAQDDDGMTMTNGVLSVRINGKNGAITEVRRIGSDHNFVNTSESNAQFSFESAAGWNTLAYLEGNDPTRTLWADRMDISEKETSEKDTEKTNRGDVKRADDTQAANAASVTLELRQRSPYIAEVWIRGTAPGCDSWERSIRICSLEDTIYVSNRLAKRAVREKESVHFAFPMNVPGGVVRYDIPYAVCRVNDDQAPGACKNWISVGRGADVSNDEQGVLWATLDAPLMEIGGTTADRIAARPAAAMQEAPAEWLAQLATGDELGAQSIYSWVMNNHWYTNYRADQEGVICFRYVLCPHDGGYDAVASQRFWIDQSQPLRYSLSGIDTEESTQSEMSLFRVENPSVVVTAMKPADDGRGVVVRLWNAAAKPVETAILGLDAAWQIVSSDIAERVGEPLEPPQKIRLASEELSTIRILPRNP